MEAHPDNALTGAAALAEALQWAAKGGHMDVMDMLMTEVEAAQKTTQYLPLTSIPLKARKSRMPLNVSETLVEGR